jgi:O-antigen ligase
VIVQKFTSASGKAFRLSGLALAVAFHAAWLAQPLGWPVRVFHLAFIALAVARPGYALLVFAGLAPLTTTLTVLLQSPKPGWTLLAAMMWSLVTGLLARDISPGARSRLRVPAFLLATIALASAIVSIAGEAVFITEYRGVRAAAAGLWSGQLFVWARPWIPLHLAVILSLALSIAVMTERAVRLDREVAVRLIRMLLVGHAAAVVLSLSRLAIAALQGEEFVAASIRVIAGVRYHSQYDINAAGSTLVIVACAGLGLIAGHHRLLTSIPLLFVLVGVWITGSRAALVALIAAVPLRAMVKAVVQGGRRAWLTGVGTVAVVAAVAIGLYAYYPAGRNVATSVAYEARVIMFRTAWRAGLSDPVFGVGLGRLPDRGREFGSAEMHRLMGPRGVTENAHNQYLQVFAELGAIGIAALALLVGCSGAMGLFGSADDRLLSWTSWGIFATLLTWLLGHPLLVPEAAVMFWLFIGIVAGLNPAPAVHSARWKVAQAGGIMLAVLTAVIAPMRASKAARSAYLDHHGIGVSATWRQDEGVSYRSAGATFALFLPSSALVAIPLRAGPSEEAVTIEVFLRGKLIDRVQVSPGPWRTIRILLPESDRRFERLEFVVLGASADGTDQELVQVGRANSMWQAPDAR